MIAIHTVSYRAIAHTADPRYFVPQYWGNNATRRGQRVFLVGHALSKGRDALNYCAKLHGQHHGVTNYYTGGTIAHTIRVNQKITL